MDNKKELSIYVGENSKKEEMQKLENKSDENKSIFTEMVDSLKYMFQSAQGKYSLETYLEVLGEFTDSEILSGEDTGLTYIGGEVVFLTKKNESDILITINLEFQDINREWKLKSSERSVKKNMFTQETVKRLETSSKIKFEIERPEKE